MHIEEIKFILKLFLIIVSGFLVTVLTFKLYDIYIKSDYEDKYQIGRGSDPETLVLQKYFVFVNLPIFFKDNEEMNVFESAKRFCANVSGCSEFGINIDGVTKTFEILDFYRRLGFCIDDKNKVIECK